jgi:hypothetical protein
MPLCMLLGFVYSYYYYFYYFYAFASRRAACAGPLDRPRGHGYRRLAWPCMARPGILALKNSANLPVHDAHKALHDCSSQVSSLWCGFVNRPVATSRARGLLGWRLARTDGRCACLLYQQRSIFARSLRTTKPRPATDQETKAII